MCVNNIDFKMGQGLSLLSRLYTILLFQENIMTSTLHYCLSYEVLSYVVSMEMYFLVA
jgi:hypothetical protein